SAPRALPPLPAVLLNPGVPLATKDVFGAFARTPPKPSGVFDTAALSGTSVESVLAALAAGTNDLAAPASALCPAGAAALAPVAATPGCGLARMSGSGATCFGLYPSEAAAAAAAKILAGGHRDWWVRASVLS